MAGLTTGRTLGPSQVVKVQHGEDHHYPQAGPNERGREEDHLIWTFIWFSLKLDGVGPVDNRPSTD